MVYWDTDHPIYTTAALSTQNASTALVRDVLTNRAGSLPLEQHRCTPVLARARGDPQAAVEKQDWRKQLARIINRTTCRIGRAEFVGRFTLPGSNLMVMMVSADADTRDTP